MRGRAPRIDEDLGLRLWVAEREERCVDALETDLAGDERAGIDLAFGEHVQRVAELQRRVPDHEAPWNCTARSPGWTIARSSFTSEIVTSEVDVVIEHRDGSISAVEVKSAATVHERDFGGLKYLKDKLGTRFKAGALLYAGANTVAFGDRLAAGAVPLSGLWAA